MSGDDMPTLSADALAALQSFLDDKQEQEERFAQLQEEAQSVLEGKNTVTMDLFQEDWQLSQFWYDEKTAEFMAKRALAHTEGEDYVGFISSPTAYVAFRNMAPDRKGFVFEYDQRFELFKEQFVFYDYNNPLDLPNALELKSKFKFLVVDPPFLNEDCLLKTLQTVKFLAHKDARVMISTGQVMQELARKLIGARVSSFYPAHRGGLANEFCCYTTFEDDELQWQDTA
ncbi:Protein-lysine N-methyltransferase efm5 [Coemansia sp. RSA 552]|nr:Protein-lysine N-methyltransferase efm5 [Coemansia sp. RSA 552]